MDAPRKRGRSLGRKLITCGRRWQTDDGRAASGLRPNGSHQRAADAAAVIREDGSAVRVGQISGYHEIVLIPAVGLVLHHDSSSHV